MVPWKMKIPVSAPAFLQVVLEIGITGGNLLNGPGRFRGEGSPPHIGVNDNPTGVDHLGQ